MLTLIEKYKLMLTLRQAIDTADPPSDDEYTLVTSFDVETENKIANIHFVRLSTPQEEDNATLGRH